MHVHVLVVANWGQKERENEYMGDILVFGIVDKTMLLTVKKWNENSGLNSEDEDWWEQIFANRDSLGGKATTE